MDHVLLEVDNGVALITVNDPDRRNAVTDEISAGLRLAVRTRKAIRRYMPWSSRRGQSVLCRCRSQRPWRRCRARATPPLRRIPGCRRLHAADGRRRKRAGRRSGPQSGAGLRCADRRTGSAIRCPLPKARHPPRRRHDLDAAARRRTAVGPRRTVVRHALRRRTLPSAMVWRSRSPMILSRPLGSWLPVQHRRRGKS